MFSRIGTVFRRHVKHGIPRHNAHPVFADNQRRIAVRAANQHLHHICNSDVHRRCVQRQQIREHGQERREIVERQTLEHRRHVARKDVYPSLRPLHSRIVAVLDDLVQPFRNIANVAVRARRQHQRRHRAALADRRQACRNRHAVVGHVHGRILTRRRRYAVSRRRPIQHERLAEYRTVIYLNAFRIKSVRINRVHAVCVTRQIDTGVPERLRFVHQRHREHGNHLRIHRRRNLLDQRSRGIDYRAQDFEQRFGR